MTDQINQVKQGVKTWRFWAKGTVSAVIGGGFGSVSSVMGIMAAEMTGLNVGDAISVHGIASVFVVGALAKASLFLKDFKI